MHLQAQVSVSVGHRSAATMQSCSTLALLGTVSLWVRVLQLPCTCLRGCRDHGPGEVNVFPFVKL